MPGIVMGAIIGFVIGFVDAAAAGAHDGGGSTADDAGGGSAAAAMGVGRAAEAPPTIALLELLRWMSFIRSGCSDDNGRRSSAAAADASGLSPQPTISAAAVDAVHCSWWKVRNSLMIASARLASGVAARLGAAGALSLAIMAE